MCFHIETIEKWWSVSWISADCANKRQVFSYWASLVIQWLKKNKQTKKPPANTGDADSIWGQEDPWRRKGQPTPVFLPGKSYGEKEPSRQQSMGSQSSWTRLSN